MRALISLGLAAVLGAATLATPQVAAAGNNWDWDNNGPGRHYQHHHSRNNNGGAFVAGTFLGLALGSIAQAPSYRYVQPYPSYNSGGWNAHVAWCSAKYRSYNPNTNLFLTYHNGWQQCRSPYGW